MKNVTCIRCDVELDNIEWGEKDSVQPYDGVAFHSRGHYGSGVFDPIGAPDYLNLVLCDVCLMENLDKIYGTGIEDLKEHFDMYNEHAKKNRNAKTNKDVDSNDNSV
jgi:hypothetical protein